MPLDAEALYQQLGRLVQEMPDLEPDSPIPHATQQWLGRAVALVEASGDIGDLVALKVAANNFNDPYLASRPQEIIAILHRALARAELAAPISAKGAFITVGSSFDAFSAIGKILGAAKQELLVVDPYMDGQILTDFLPTVPERVPIRLLADAQGHKPSLKPAIDRWRAQFGNQRPVEGRLTAARTLHDRLVAIDGAVVWTLTQSFNSFAARSPASIVRVDDETTALKIRAYEAMWQAASLF